MGVFLYPISYKKNRNRDGIQPKSRSRSEFASFFLCFCGAVCSSSMIGPESCAGALRSNGFTTIWEVPISLFGLKTRAFEHADYMTRVATLSIGLEIQRIFADQHEFVTPFYNQLALTRLPIGDILDLTGHFSRSRVAYQYVPIDDTHPSIFLRLLTPTHRRDFLDSHSLP